MISSECGLVTLEHFEKFKMAARHQTILYNSNVLTQILSFQFQVPML